MASLTTRRSHISNLSLQHFRGFREAANIPLAPLTFLVGPNSSGKSALSSAILFAIQSEMFAIGPEPYICNWTGPWVDLGSFADVAYRHSTRQPIRIGITFTDLRREPHNSDGFISPITVEYQIAADSHDPSGYLQFLSVIDTDSSTGLVFELDRRTHRICSVMCDKITIEVKRKPEQGSFHYYELNEVRTATKVCIKKSIGAKLLSSSASKRLSRFLNSYSLAYFFSGLERVSSARSGPKRWYPLSVSPRYGHFMDSRSSLLDNVDPGTLLAHTGPNRFRYGRRASKKAPPTIGSALKTLAIANKLSVNRISKYHNSIKVVDSITGITSNLIDVGFGAAQIIPVILGVRDESTGPLFVEQPEIHLHPKAQGEVAELLCDASMRRQVIVETHSEHLINRARLRVAEGKMKFSDVMVLYVDRSKRGSNVHPIPIDSAGDFTREWPDGFFDERFRDTMKLVASKKRANGVK